MAGANRLLSDKDHTALTNVAPTTSSSDFYSGERHEAHGRCLRFFRNSSLSVSEELRQYRAYQQNELHDVQEFTGIRRKGTELELRVKWRGFSVFLTLAA